ncbi:GNAT family N-acetyltransferase [Sanguibacter hominis ATCC BAA-789]|uniref:GNAT family N-acetyltransferase n=1 Tax=Sanguibacter hominis ATCC BAA-789 TaxID=1312740 RepID=A0A9X5F8N4_9MICO|nr:GNAT family N-acetyltransferase [Sanguibacter hominis ATCC BAA-789]
MGRDLAPGLEQARQLTDVDLPAALELCAADPVGSVLGYCRLVAAAESGLASSGGQVWGFPAEGPLEAVCWAGANLVPVLSPWLTPRRRDEACAAFAALARDRGRRSSSIVGRAGAVLALWNHLDGAWGPAREIRPEQPSLVIASSPAVEPDPRVRASLPEELGTLLPACVSMFVEEVGYSPLSASSSGYERRVLQLISEGRSYVRVDGAGAGRRGTVVFKAEVGALVPQVAQLQGVWVTPSRRGEGLAAPGVAAVVSAVLATHAPLVSLYVNAYNTRALAAYERVGFVREGTYATVMF